MTRCGQVMLCGLYLADLQVAPPSVAPPSTFGAAATEGRRCSDQSTRSRLPDINLEQGVGMFMAPAPVRLLIVVFESGKIAIFAMVLFCIHAVRLIFMSIPFMIVIVFFVVVTASGFVIFGSQCHWRH